MSKTVWKPRFPKLTRLICKNGERGVHFSLSTKWRRQNTQYVDDKSNWICSCKSCFVENEKYWAEQWNDFYSGVL